MRNATGFKVCTICRETKAFGDFPMSKADFDPTYASSFKSYCKPCYAERMRKYWKRKPSQYRKLIDSNRKRRRRNLLRSIWERARSGAAKRDIKFTITPEDIGPLPRFCPVLGMELEYFAVGYNRPESASLDRIDNSKGYEPGNVRIISYRANALKRDATAEELRAVIDYIEGRPRHAFVPRLTDADLHASLKVAICA